ncbi:hypothetical protein [Myxosarcina sp. GI1(2024)]
MTKAVFSLTDKDKLKRSLVLQFISKNCGLAYQIKILGDIGATESKGRWREGYSVVARA